MHWHRPRTTLKRAVLCCKKLYDGVAVAVGRNLTYLEEERATSEWRRPAPRFAHSCEADPFVSCQWTGTVSVGPPRRCRPRFTHIRIGIRTHSHTLS